MNVLPATVNLAVDSAPAGVSVTVDGISHATPYAFAAVVGSGHELLAPTVTTISGVEAAFDTWNTPAGVVPNAFASITVPATDTTVAARYNSTADGFAISDASVVEGDSGSRAVALTVSRSVASASVSSVDWATAPGTASATTDYKAASGTVTFAAGETSRAITVPVKSDTTVEPDEQFSVNLSNAQGGAIVQPSGTVTVLNDDPAGAGLRADVGDVEVMEGGSGTRSAAFTVTLSAKSPGAVSVDYTTVDGSAVAPGDYAPASGTLTFAAGQYSQTVEVAVSGDRDGEPTEQFTLALSNPLGVTLGRDTGVARIATDDPLAVVSISSGNFYEGDSGKPKVPFTVSLSVPSAKPVMVDWAASHGSTDSNDVKLASGTVTIPAGALQAVVDVTTVGDTVAEPDEVFIVTLSNATGAIIGADTGTGVEVILNDDPGSPASRLAIGDVAVPEGHAGVRDAQFLVTLATPSASATTVHFATADGSATAGSDYVARSGTLNIPAGAVSRILTIPIIGDSLHEGDETLTVTLSNASGATITHAVGTATILDDD
jgi:hypothetical protein